MRLLIGLAEALPPQASGGSQRVAFEIAAGLRACGDQASVAGRLIVRRADAARRVLDALRHGRSYAAGRRGDVPVYYFFRERRGFPALLDTLGPEVVLLHAMSAMPLADMIRQRRIPLVIYWHDVEFHKLRGDPCEAGVRHVANSSFTATRLRDRFGIDAVVIPPIFASLATPAPAPVTGDRVLFINPVADKGLEHALEIAAMCPAIPFEFLESWTLNAEQRRALLVRLAALPNVTLTSHQTDMAPVYERARLLIAPSRWEEAWGRVATEAQAAGLPVIATRIGGLTEAVGSGGVLMPRNAPAQAWAAAVESVWNDPVRAATLVAAARAHATRREVDPAHNLQRLRHELALASGHDGDLIQRSAS